MAAAAALPERIQAIASIHGANLVTERDDSPHRMAGRIRCESYFACAETDIWAPPETVEKLQAALVAAGTPHRIEWYPGAQHGFVFPRREGIYHRASACGCASTNCSIACVSRTAIALLRLFISSNIGFIASGERAFSSNSRARR
jgi:dienelactone hydrolase